MQTKSIDHNLSVGFYRSAKRFAQREALAVHNTVYTYEQLSYMAAAVKAKIKDGKEKADQLVALFAYRSPTAYAGVLGILASGCGYVPLNPEFPTERCFKILDLAKTKLVIVSRECQAAFDAVLELINTKMTFILVGIEGIEQYSKNYPLHHFIGIHDLLEQGQALEVEAVTKDGIAYLLFTSGSTGEPKGVPVSHHNVRSYVKFITSRYDINEQDRCSQMHDMTFDFSIHDIYPTWEKGACLCVATKEDKLLPVSYIQKNKLTSWASVPSVAVIIDKYGRLQANAFPHIRHSFFCGEALYASVAQKWQAATPHAKLINLYGPTETTMAISYYDWDSDTSPKECVNGVVPIGRIFDGQIGRVVREDEQEAAFGEPGELCLSGTQVTKGYWNNSLQTKMQYVTFPDTGDVLWYRTGDLVQKDKQGCLYYLGRVDNQVKILGNRVELGEIDKVLRDASGVELAVSIPWPMTDGNADGVVAFIGGNKDKNENSILEYCRHKLPKYMVPTKINFIGEMPFNTNGKIDRLRLKQWLEKNHV